MKEDSMVRTIDDLLNLIYKKENKEAATFITPKTINMQNAAGFTPLMIAASARNKRMVLHLLANGADMSLKSKAGCTVWDFANTEMKQFLKSAVEIIKQMPIKHPFVYNGYCERVLSAVNKYTRENSGHTR